MDKSIARRLARLRSKFRRNKIDAMLVVSDPNVRYLSGFTGDSTRLLITPAGALLLTDFRYVEQAEAECKGYRVIDTKHAMHKAVCREARRLGVKRLGLAPASISLAEADTFLELLRKRKIEPVRVSGLVEDLRSVKDAGEIKTIQASVDAAGQALEHIKPFLVPGIREIDISAEMEHYVRGLGFDGMGFPTIVAFGPNGSRCHHMPSRRRLRAGDPVLIDWGVRCDGYVSDLTRTLFHTKISRKFERIYRTVYEAQRRAIRRIRPGVTCGAVDAAARNYITKAGFGRRFGHGLGHSIGLQVHEGPGFAKGSGTVLKRGMVLTVEPGIYIPGLGGVRIEDDVLVTAAGARVLSSVPKRLRDVVIGG